MAQIAKNPPDNSQFVSLKEFRDLSMIASSFHNGVDRIPYSLAEMFVVKGNFDWQVNKP